jgi:hypothetical protein
VTSVIAIDEDEDPDASSISGQLAGRSVADLDVSPELEEGYVDEEGESGILGEAEEDEVVDVEDENFSEEYASSGSEELLEHAPARALPLEPSWGMPAQLMVLAAGVLVAANVWLMFEGLATMWTGAEPSGAAASLIGSLAGLF